MTLTAKATRRRRSWRPVVFATVTLLVLGAAALAGWRLYVTVRDGNDFAATGLRTAGGDDDPPRVGEIDRILRRHSIECTTNGPLPHGALVDSALSMERIPTSERKMGPDTDLWVDDYVDALDDLAPDVEYEVLACGNSLIVVDGDDARYGMITQFPPNAVKELADAGLRLGSLAPAELADVTAELDRLGQTCDADSTTVQRAVLEAEAAAKFPTDGTLPSPAMAAEQDALKDLPTEGLDVTTCGTSRVVSVDGYALLVALGPGTTPIGSGFLDDHNVVVVGP